MVDLGKDVTFEKFRDAVKENDANIVAMSTLMTTTMDSMSDITVNLREIFPNLKYMIGGAPVSQDFSDSIGAHFYGEDSQQAVSGAHKLMGISDAR